MSESGEMTMGQRIEYYRKRKGMTRQGLGVRVQRGENWVYKVEKDLLQVDKYSLLLDLVSVLGVESIQSLTGQHLLLASEPAAQHASLEGLRAVMNELPGTCGDRLDSAVPSVAALTGQVEQAWAVYDHATDRYADLGPKLPELLGQAHRTLRGASGPEQLLAVTALVRVYNLVQVYAKRLGQSELARLAADRAVALAADSGDTVLMAAAAWNLGAIMLNRGEGDYALDVARTMIGLMTPVPEDASHEYLSLYGALHLVAVIACARSGRAADGYGYLEDASRAAQRLGADRNDWGTSFGAANVAMHACHLSGEQGNSADVLRLAADVELPEIIPLERRTRYLAEIMGAHRLQREDVATLYVIKEIVRISPEEAKYFSSLRAALRDLLTRERAHFKSDLRELAAHVGVLA